MEESSRKPASLRRDKSILRTLRYQYRPRIVLPLRIDGVPLVLLLNDGRVAGPISRHFFKDTLDVPDSHSLYLYILQGEPVLGQGMRQISTLGSRKRLAERYYETDETRIILDEDSGVAIYLASPDHYVVGDLSHHINRTIEVINMVVARTALSRREIDCPPEEGWSDGVYAPLRDAAVAN